MRLHRRPAVGLAGAPLLGVVFGLGWTPCIGPTLGAVLGLGLNEGQRCRGGVLAVAYCLGLGLPFVLPRSPSAGRCVPSAGCKQHYVWVMRLGGGDARRLGVLLVTGAGTTCVVDLQVWVNGFIPAV